MNWIDGAQIFRIFESGYVLPPLSVIALKLLEVASNEEASDDEIVKIIEQDPSLTVRLLNVSNSVLYGTGTPITTLSRAVMRLGHNQIRLMALSISLRDAFPMGKVDQFDYELFWRVSLYRGLIAKSLAHKSKAANPEEAFLCGLTMEIGLPILFDLCMRGQTSPFKLDIEPLEELLEKEKTYYGMNHREVGAAALKFWNFPQTLVGCQETCPSDQRSSSSKLSVLCYLARLFSQVIVKGPQAFKSFYLEAEAVLRLSQEKIHDAVFETLAEVESTARGFKLQIDRERDIIGILENAKQALVRISQTVSQSPDEHHRFLPSFASIDREDKSIKNALEAVAHEIRNPLTAVGGFARRLAGSLDPESPSGKYARVILDEALRLEKILSEMPEQSSHPASHPLPGEGGVTSPVAKLAMAD